MTSLGCFPSYIYWGKKGGAEPLLPPGNRLLLGGGGVSGGGEVKFEFLLLCRWDKKTFIFQGKGSDLIFFHF